MTDKMTVKACKTSIVINVISPGTVIAIVTFVFPIATLNRRPAVFCVFPDSN
jgi:hypothetical protein